jgi:hypothetical protein
VSSTATATRTLDFVKISTTIKEINQIFEPINLQDGSKINPEGEVGTLWDGNPFSKPTLAIIYPPVNGQTTPLIKPINENNPLSGKIVFFVY